MANKIDSKKKKNIIKLSLILSFLFFSSYIIAEPIWYKRLAFYEDPGKYNDKNGNPIKRGSKEQQDLVYRSRICNELAERNFHGKEIDFRCTTREWISYKHKCNDLYIKSFDKNKCMFEFIEVSEEDPVSSFFGRGRIGNTSISCEEGNKCTLSLCENKEKCDTRIELPILIEDDTEIKKLVDDIFNDYEEKVVKRFYDLKLRPLVRQAIEYKLNKEIEKKFLGGDKK